MNGRIYDPLLGRMLSADVLVAKPGQMQSYNRYSYATNNPLVSIDPTGFVATRFEGTDEEKAKLQKAIEDKCKADANFARSYASTVADPNRGLVVRFAPSNAAPVAATAGASSAQIGAQSSGGATGPQGVQQSTPGAPISQTPATASGTPASPGVQPVPRQTQFLWAYRVKSVETTDNTVTTPTPDPNLPQNTPGFTTTGLDRPTFDQESDGSRTMKFGLHQNITMRPEIMADAEKKDKVLRSELQHTTDGSTIFNGKFRREAIANLQDKVLTNEELERAVSSLSAGFANDVTAARDWWDSTQRPVSNGAARAFHDRDSHMNSAVSPTTDQLTQHLNDLQ